MYSVFNGIKSAFQFVGSYLPNKKRDYEQIAAKIVTLQSKINEFSEPRSLCERFIQVIKNIFKSKAAITALKVSKNFNFLTENMDDIVALKNLIRKQKSVPEGLGLAYTTLEGNFNGILSEIEKDLGGKINVATEQAKEHLFCIKKSKDLNLKQVIKSTEDFFTRAGTLVMAHNILVNASFRKLTISDQADTLIAACKEMGLTLNGLIDTANASDNISILGRID
jgi:hypothetical protein